MAAETTLFTLHHGDLLEMNKTLNLPSDMLTNNNYMITVIISFSRLFSALRHIFEPSHTTGSTLKGKVWRVS